MTRRLLPRLRGPRPRGRGALRRIDDDSGAVAVLVAILLPTVMLGVGALALDLGSVYLAKNAQQGIAQLAALAGARQLPNVPAARKAALTVMCAPGNQNPAWPVDTCTYDPADPVSWKGARAAGTGSIAFFTGDANDDGLYKTADDPQTVTEGDQGLAIQVTLPRTQVDFRFAGIFGNQYDSTGVTEQATARIGTPLGTGVLPFAVTPDDIKKTTPTADNRFCIRDTTVAPQGNVPAPAGFPYSWTTPTLLPGSIKVGASGTAREVTLAAVVPLFTGFPTPNPQVFIIDNATGTPHTAAVKSASSSLITVTIPAGLAAGDYRIWVQNAAKTRVTRTANFRIDVDANPGPCDRPSANRGYLDIRRQTVPDKPADLEDNIKQGVKPTIHTYQWAPGLLDLPPLLPPIPVVSGLVCGSPIFTTLYTLVSVVDDLLNINCVDVETTPGFSDSITDGMLDQNGNDQGRMLRKCTTNPAVTSTPRTFDGSNLFSLTNNELVDPTKGGFGPTVKLALESGATPQPGWIKDKVFSCPRFGLVPIIDPGSFVNGRYPVIGHTYVWLDDGADAFPLWNGNKITAVQGHIVDPRWFMNATTGDTNVEGSTVVGQYLGPDLPKEAVLVEDD